MKVGAIEVRQQETCGDIEVTFSDQVDEGQLDLGEI